MALPIPLKKKTLFVSGSLGGAASQYFGATSPLRIHHSMTGLCPFKLFKDTKMFLIRDLMAFPAHVARLVVEQHMKRKGHVEKDSSRRGMNEILNTNLTP